ncbi:MAG: RtcB family protein [Alphaproteobacteria bacterium]|nr:RtcB family protein [Alphaproteobacteria bacterium]
MTEYDYIPTKGVPIKAWTRGLPIEPQAMTQLHNVAALPFVHSHVAVMPDVHWGKGATVGSVIPCKGAIVPAAVGVDIGCGMMAIETGLTSHQLPDALAPLRSAIEATVPHGRTSHDPAKDRGSWQEVPNDVAGHWQDASYADGTLRQGLERLIARHPALAQANSVHHLGTLGTGNHFIELCLDEHDHLWIMLHSGSRGIGNRIGSYFIERAKREAERWHIQLPDRDLSWLPEGTPLFDDYLEAVGWAQAFARTNRDLMMARIIETLRTHLTDFRLGETAINCHHNYVVEEEHFGAKVWVTRKGALRARVGDLGIIPGSMGARSYIVRGKGNPASFHSCSHGAGRTMSRTQAQRRFTVADHERATAGVECRKDAGVIDETPMAYKDIDQVIAAQRDLVEVVHTLKQIVCVKG